MEHTLPTFITTRGVSKILGKHRSTVANLRLQGRLKPAGEVDLGGELQPLFEVSEVLRLAHELTEIPTITHV